MSDLIHGPRLKISRAYEHLESLDRAERQFFQGNDVSLVVETESETGDRLLKVRLDAAPPEQIHILAGEILYQLRSTFDQIAVAFARMSTVKPNTNKIYFPTGDSLKSFRASRKKNLDGIDSDLVGQIIRLKPYDGGDDTLRAVFRLANVDKHLELVPAATCGMLAQFQGWEIQNAKTGLILSGMQSLYDGVLISNLGKNGTISATQENPKIQIAGRIRLGNASIYEGRLLIPFLKELCDRTSTVFQRLETYCRATGRLT